MGRLKVKHTNNPLNLQKQILKESAWDFFGAFLLFLLFSAIAIVFWLLDQVELSDMLFANFIILSIATILLTIAIRRFSILRRLNKIKFSSEKTVSINCKKVSFLYSPIAKGTSLILCVAMTDEAGKKFYYVFTKENIPFDIMKKKIKGELLGRRLELICYRDTNIVKYSPLQ